MDILARHVADSVEVNGYLHWNWIEIGRDEAQILYWRKYDKLQDMHSAWFRFNLDVPCVLYKH